MKARLLRSLIAERVSSDPGPGAGWTIGQCRHCDEKVWLSNAWVELLAGDPEAVASCFACACAHAGDLHEHPGPNTPGRPLDGAAGTSVGRLGG